LEAPRQDDVRRGGLEIGVRSSLARSVLCAMSKIGRYIAMSIVPTMPPTTPS
jgi:hypothetical protein